MKFLTAIHLLSVISTAAAFAPLSSSSLRRPLNSDTALFYENAKDGGADSNVWSVLAHTEKWISDTLASTETASGNPYSRKEVNYVCETNEESPMIAANIFKRLREARELGQRHGTTEEDRKTEQGPGYRPHTLRQTQVMVIPGNQQLCDSFHAFDDFINAVNAARRNARDYITDASLEKLDQELAGEASQDWSVSVNCAHLHPDFGKKTPEEQLQQLQKEEEQGEVDVHAQEYAKKRLLARQSPYPTIVVEVRATPTPDWGQAPPPAMPTAAVKEEEEEEEEEDAKDYKYNRKELLEKDVTAADIQKLEALFGKAAAKKDEKENSFYDVIGKTKSIEEVSTINHLQMAQEWVRDSDEKFSPTTSAFTESDATEIDHAYEFVFTNIAMMQEQGKQDTNTASRRQYLIMPNFLSSSATSLEKFTGEVANIVNTLPDLKQKVKLSTFHPEHVQQGRRSPVSIICLQWTEAGAP